MQKNLRIAIGVIIGIIVVGSILFTTTCTLALLPTETSIPTSTLPTPSTGTTIPTSTPTFYLLYTALVARNAGILVNESGCIRVKPYKAHKGDALVWPLDLEMSIEDGQIRVVSGLVSGDRREYVIKFGERVVLSGGWDDNLDEQLLETIPDNCPGPYFVVGGVMEPDPVTPEPK